MDFCQLHNHTEYSQLDGMGTCDQYAERAKQLGFKYLGITDHGCMDGLIKFQKSCAKHEITPILGCELYLTPDVSSKDKLRGHACVWVKSQTGFENLARLLTYANTKGFYYKPRVSFDYFLDNCEGLVVSTACLISFARVFKDDGIQFFEDLYDTIGDDLYTEIMPHKLLKQKHWNIDAIALARRHGLKTIATNDCHYVRRPDFKAQDVLLCIQRKTTMDDKNRFRFTIQGLYLRTAREMEKAFRRNGHPFKTEFLKNTLEIAQKCEGFTIPKQEISLPRVPGVPINPRKARAWLWDLCNDGYIEKCCSYRMAEGYVQNIIRDKIYYQRLKEEFTLITEKKFERYFFMVWEVINWCKQNDILVGPGRGSVGGSLMAYLLGITSVDPIKHNLIFDRFINKDRIDYPDIDIDFEDRKRHLVRQHLESVYGVDKVAGVSSFGRMKAKMVVKDVGRAFGVHWSETDQITKLIEDDKDDPDQITTAVENYSEVAEYARKYPEVIKFAKKLEGQVRGYGQHAAALVVSKEHIGNSGRCNLRMQDGLSLVNWEKEDTEYVGLMKLDVLGLKLLSILSEARRLIKANHKQDIKFETLPLDDEKVLKDISNGEVTGVFQFNTFAMRQLIENMGVEEFNHLADAVALVRPGPAKSGMTDEYIRRKHGGEWEPMHKIYEEITKDTYGLLVYQEQIMQVVSRIADLPYSTADKIRKIIGKKRDKKEFEKYKKMFLRGCKKTGYFSQDEAKHFWDGLEEWARYGFNRSHSVEYAILGYWCSWLKHYYAVEFICASLTYGAEEKKKEVIEEAYKLGLQVMLPKVGKSDAVIWRAIEGKLYIPFIEVKGIGDVKAVEAAGETTANKSVNIKKFYSRKPVEKASKIGGKFGELLDSIGAYDERNPEMTEEIKKLFKFRVVTNPRSEYAKLYDLFENTLTLDKLDPALDGEDDALKPLAKRHDILFRARIPKSKWHKFVYNLKQCQKCKLIEQCRAPVSPSPGIWNIMIVGEAPGIQEDEERIGFVGKSGEKLWKALRPYPRKMFHVSNIAKCFPRQTKKPTPEEIKICAGTYLEQEIELLKPTVILSFGNTGLQFFRQQKAGITDMSGKVIWNEKYGAWIVYCMHPAATLHNPDNQMYFNAGVKRFKQLIKTLGLPKPKR